MNILAQDWIAASILTVALFAYFETLGPFFRQFRLDDASLQHPFAYHERVSDTKLYLPDFLARCGAKAGTPVAEFVTVEVCTAPLGSMYLADGMKSTPSGHSSVAFAAMFYVFLWLGAEGRLPGPFWLTEFVRTAPLAVAAYIALSRTQDYRHHFKDIVLGSAIGVGGAWLMYKKYHGTAER
ncbi:hypothetical protein E0198_004604 [Clavispora lusitaniae]|nr:hypothetical protein E0198_004604 [Clavispora lusitaniae]